ncbi:hypothetical protein AMJ40_03685 [candidate division TA06 bacterium DG_26]|uniref:Asparaginase n=1 Tax=candidate division TA06 bacterium DG_26 TaxID=1703771 RepID=A0A0S7WIX7_UNCT6|nr:MAG: hypothetical protein AMJ40_03685 [candidate division TA06 bacterium DG_26]
MIAIVAHGGISVRGRRERQRIGVKEGVEKGYDVLVRGGSALDAVELAVVVMEDNPVFNAGTGSALTIEGEAEMDASIMADDLRCGAVAAIRWVKNPIKVARKVMEETDHIILAGEGATRFAWMMGFAYHNPVTQDRWKMMLQELSKLGPDHRYLPKTKRLVEAYRFGTVGAVALDRRNRIAVATSTGGMTANLPGRVGDTPVIGAGTYADDMGGASATGHGEAIIRLCLAKAVVERLKGLPVQEAVDDAISVASKRGYRCGVVAVDKEGRIGIGASVTQVAYAWMRDGHCEVF